MVLYQNITIGQRVEVKLCTFIYKGVVKFKGSVVNRKGEWVGVSLDLPDGDNDGMVQGRRYFQCNMGHGVFVRATNIRFIPLKRCLYNRYHKVRDSSFVDERLFGSQLKEEDEPTLITKKYQDRATRSFDDLHRYGSTLKQYPLSHSVGNHIPAATMRRPKTAMGVFGYSTTPIHREYDIDGLDFITSPTIPKTHMPYSALRNQVKRGWEGSHYVREMSVGTGRDSIAYSQWNDISI